jgi:hypothetical protein
MVVVGGGCAKGGGIGGGGESGQGQGQPPPPIIFAKVVVKYAPFLLPSPLHDIIENYMKNLQKFMGEGYLIATENIAFFYQFVDILGIEHKYFYSRMLVKTFEGQVRTWFRGLPVGSIQSYYDLQNPFLRQWGEKKDHLYYLTEFEALRKNNFESVLKFTQRFKKM